MTHWLVVALLALSSTAFGLSRSGSVPKSRSNLKADEWFPFVFSKIAPLEQWRFEASPADVKRESYTSDEDYESSLRNTWQFPRFCFALFRPAPDLYRALLRAIEQYQGAVSWIMLSGCVSAYPAGSPLTFEPALGNDPETLARMEDTIRNPPKADPEFVRKAILDIPNLCSYLEKHLRLQGKSPQDFDEVWLTSEGLRNSRAESEDFYERGDWITVLTREEPTTEVGAAGSSQHVGFSYELRESESAAILADLGADLQGHREIEPGPLLPDYPMLSKFPLSEIDSAFYSRGEVALLLCRLRPRFIGQRPSAD